MTLVGKNLMAVINKGIVGRGAFSSKYLCQLKNTYGKRDLVFDLFDFILYVSSTIFQFCRDGSSSVEPALS